MIYIVLTWLFFPLWWTISRFRGLLTRTPRRIVVVEIAGIGDVVCSTAVFRSIRAHYPDAHIELMVEPASVDIIANDPNLDVVIGWPVQRLRGFSGRAALAWHVAGFDMMICLNPGATQIEAGCWAALPIRLSVLPSHPKLSYRMLRPLLSGTRQHDTKQVFVQTQLDLLQTLGIRNHDCRKSLTIRPDIVTKVNTLLPEGTLIGIAIGSGLQMKEIPEQVLVDVISNQSSLPATTIILIGGEKEREKGTRLQAQFPDKNIIDLTGRLTLTESAGVLTRLTVFVGVNSGLTHMADALETPIVCMAGPSDVHEQGPNGSRVIILQQLPPCAPCDTVFSTPKTCQIGTRDCITRITSNEVIHAINSLKAHPIRHLSA